MNINIKILDPRAIIPKYQHGTDAGFDLHAILEHDLFLEAGASHAIDTGVAFEIPEGYEGQIRPRSGLSFKNGIVCSLGTIDSGFSNAVRVCLYNHSFQTMRFKTGDRVAQMVICPIVRASFTVVTEFAPSERGDKGFGSTGVK